MTKGFPNSRPFLMEFLRLSSEGPFTVQLFNSQASAVSGESEEEESRGI